MRIKVTRYPAGRRDLDVAGAESQEEINVPTRPFLQLSGVMGLVSGLVTTLITLATFWLVTKPDAEAKRSIDLGNFHAGLLRQALQVQTSDGRKSSLRVLVDLGLLKPANLSDLRIYLDPADKDTLPYWPAPAVADRRANSGAATQGRADSVRGNPGGH